MIKSLLLIPCLGTLALLAMSAAAPEVPVEATVATEQAGNPWTATTPTQAPVPVTQAETAPSSPPLSPRAQRKARRSAHRPDASEEHPRRHRPHRRHRPRHHRTPDALGS